MKGNTFFLAGMTLLCVGVGCTSPVEKVPDAVTLSPAPEVVVDVTTTAPLFIAGEPTTVPPTDSMPLPEPTVVVAPQNPVLSEPTRSKIIPVQKGEPSIEFDGFENGATISGPFVVHGTATLWYFEGSFSVEVYDANGVLLGTGIASALDDWMVTTPVPFEAEVVAYTEPNTSTGIVRFIRANPSDTRAQDRAVDVMVRFERPESTTEPVPEHQNVPEGGQYEMDLLSAVNTYRQGLGLAPLVSDAALHTLAIRHSETMQQEGQLSHNGFEDRYATVGYRLCVENVGWNYATGQAMFDGWKSSPGHDTNMKHVGISSVGLARVGAYVTMFACGNE